nr:protein STRICTOSIDINE SYNTHASE-LIKE 11-like [Coffea arabica]
MANIIVVFPNKRIVETVLCFSIFLFCYLPTAFCSGFRQKLYLPVPGPESYAFDSAGRGPYASLADGRVLRYLGPAVGFVEYGYTKADRPRRFCDGTNRTDISQICGRPTGLGFYYKTGELFLGDADLGLVVIPSGGGPGIQLASSAEGVRFGFPDGLEVDQATGIVYFTDASSRYNLSQINNIVSNRDATGRLLKYDPRTKNVTVLLRGLSGAAGVAISEDGSYLLVTQFVIGQVSKYWLKGPLANTAEVLVNMTGMPDKIKRNTKGEYWIAVTVTSKNSTQLQGQRIDGDGNSLETLTFSPDFDSSLITEVQEYKGALYLASLYVGYVGVYR